MLLSMRAYIRSLEFMVILTGAALAQDNGTTKPNLYNLPSPGDIVVATKAPESPEHRFAQKQYDNQVEVVAGLSNQIETILVDVDAPSKESPEVHHLYVIAQLDRGDKLAIRMGVEEEELAQRKLRVEHADECVAVFQATTGKKTSDVTIKDTEQVKACQSMNLYPPQK